MTEYGKCHKGEGGGLARSTIFFNWNKSPFYGKWGGEFLTFDDGFPNYSDTVRRGALSVHEAPEADL